MTLHGPDPALLGNDHRHGLALDHRLREVDVAEVRRIREARPAFAERRLLPIGFADAADLPGDRLPLLGLRAEQFLDLALLVRELVELGLEALLLELPERAEPGVEDRV